MKIFFIISTVILILVKFFSFFVESMRRDSLSALIKKTGGIIIFIIAVGTFKSCDSQEINLNLQSATDFTFAELSKDAKEDIFLSAEETSGTILGEEISELFKTEIKACIVKINRETLVLESVEIYLRDTNVSTAEIKKYIKDKYGSSEVNIY